MANTYDVTVKLQAIADAITQGGGGGGGTTVIANPTGTPTDDLDTIQIGNTIYDIPGSGGGRPFSATDIYVNQTTSNENTITLTTSYQDFDEVRILVKENVSDIYYPEQIISKSELDVALNDQTNVSMTPYFFSGSYYCYYKVTSTTTLVLQSQAGAFHIRKIIGIKYGNGIGTDEAVNVNYDNTTSGLTATNVQDAIDENADSIDTLNSNFDITHYETTGNKICWVKQGDLVFVSLYGTTSADTPPANMPIPYNNNYVKILGTNGNETVGYIQYYNNTWQTVITAGKSAYGSGCYICEDN